MTAEGVGLLLLGLFAGVAWGLLLGSLPGSIRARGWWPVTSWIQHTICPGCGDTYPVRRVVTGGDPAAFPGSFHPKREARLLGPHDCPELEGRA